MKRELTCIGCPMGCRIAADLENGEVSNIQGYSCKIGERYAREELTAPKRMVTGLCPVLGTHVPLAVKTSKPIDKRLIFACLKQIAAYTAVTPIHAGTVLIQGVCGTDVDILATQECPEPYERNEES